MGAIDIKEYIISKIKLTSDEDFLMKVKEFIDVGATVYSLSNEQINLVEEANEQYQNGNYIDEIEMNKRVDKWIKEK